MHKNLWHDTKTLTFGRQALSIMHTPFLVLLAKNLTL